MGWGRNFSNVQSDLLNLEINTIVKDKIGALKMPEPEIAVNDVKEDYLNKLTDIYILLDDIGMGYTSDQEHTYSSASEAFTGIANRSDLIATHIQQNEKGWAKEAKKNAGVSSIKDVKENLNSIHNSAAHLGRMKRNSLIVVSILEANPELTDLNFTDLVKIRKIWEIGTEDIVMQTVVQLDGDVISRIIPQYAEDGNEGLHSFHRLGVQLSIKHWSTLLEIVKSFFGNVFKRWS